MALKLNGTKRGMTQLFDEAGHAVACTVIEAEPSVITQIKTKETDGYNALQLGFKKVTAKDPRRKEARTPKPQRGHFEKNGIEPRKHLAESRFRTLEGYEVGQEIGLAEFTDVKYVDVTSRSQGKGYQGVIKKHNFGGGPASHGSGFHRAIGSTGGLHSHGRCFPGDERASRMGFEMKTVQNLKVILVDAEKNLLVVKGAVPGATGSLVSISAAVKHQEKQGR